MSRLTFLSERAFAVGEDLVAAWDALCDRVPDARFHHRPAWVAAVDRFRPEARIRVHAAFEGGRLVAVVPLGRSGAPGPDAPHGVRVGPAQDPSHFTDALVMPEWRTGALVEGLLDHVRRVEGPCDVLRFPAVPADGALLRAVGEGGPHHVRRRAGEARVVDVSHPAWARSLSPRQLRNLDRLARRAERELGSLSLRTWRGARGMDEGFDLFTTVEGAGWKGDWRHLSALGYRPRERRFYREVLRGLAVHGEARVDALCAGGRPLAAHLALRGGDTWYLLKIGYDEQYRRWGPGGLLLRRFLDAMAADPSVDRVHLVTAPAWADRWHMDAQEVTDLWIRTPERAPGVRPPLRATAPSRPATDAPRGARAVAGT